MEINIEDYFSESEIREIVKEEVKGHVRGILGQKETSFITQLAKSLAKDGVQELIPNFEELLNEHIKAQIESIKLETIFWESFGWRSTGNKLINKILANNEPLIEAKIKEMFKTLS